MSSQQPTPLNPHGQCDLALLQLVTFRCWQHTLQLICIIQFSATCSCQDIRSYKSVPVEPAVNNCYYLGRSVVRNCCAQLTVFYSKSLRWQFQFVTKFCNLEIQIYILVCLACRPLTCILHRCRCTQCAFWVWRRTLWLMETVIWKVKKMIYCEI